MITKPDERTKNVRGKWHDRPMTNNPIDPASNQTLEPVPQPPVSAVTSEKKEKNVLGIVAIVIAIVGFIFACIPGAFILGWIALPIAFILSIVSLFMKGRGKGLGIAALIISIVGTIVGVIVFIGTAVIAVDDALSGGETTVTAPEATSEEATADDKQGTRANPYPIGSAITQGDWTVVVNSVNLDATQAIADENPFNESAPDGQVYILANITATYNGTKADGEMVSTILAYVTADGQTVDAYTSMVVAPEQFNLGTTLYEGAASTGNIVFTVPAATAAEGVLAVTPSMFGDKTFVAVK